MTNMVMMGMGEPFHKYPATMKFLSILNDPAGMGMGARRMTVSSSGVVPFIEKLADEPLQVNLAISLHAPNQELRETLVPIARKHPLSELLRCRRPVHRQDPPPDLVRVRTDGRHQRCDEIALELARLMRGRLCHLNVIPFNKVDVLEFERPTR